MTKEMVTTSTTLILKILNGKNQPRDSDIKKILKKKLLGELSKRKGQNNPQLVFLKKNYSLEKNKTRWRQGLKNHKNQ